MASASPGWLPAMVQGVVGVRSKPHLPELFVPKRRLAVSSGDLERLLPSLGRHCICFCSKSTFEAKATEVLPLVEGRKALVPIFLQRNPNVAVMVDAAIEKFKAHAVRDEK